MPTNFTPFGPPTRWLELADCELPYWRVGQGPDVVLVHGWPIDSRTWRDVVPLLAERYTCHLFDLPGAGQSRWTKATRVGLAEHAATTRAVIDEIGLERYAFVAHDSGAVFARLVAAGDPDRVRAVVSGNTEIPGHVPWQLKAFTAARAVPGGAGALLRMMRFGPIRRSKLGFGACFVDPAHTDGAFHDLFTRPILEDDRVLAGHLLLLEHFDPSVIHSLAGAHGQISAPTRFIWGVSDPWFPLKKARPMVDQMGGPADLVTIDPGALFAHEEFPRQFVELAEPTLQAGFAT